MVRPIALPITQPIALPMGAARVAGVGGYDPITALGSKLLAYWDADTLATINRDGQLRVASWSDRIGGYSPSQATDANKPVLSEASFNGRNLIVADGLTQQLTLAGVPLPTAGVPCEVWVLGTNVEPGANSTRKNVFSYGNTGAVGQARQMARLGVSGVNRINIVGSTGSADIALTGTTEDMSGRFVAHGVFDATAISGDLNGLDQGSTAGVLGGTATTRTRIFANASTTAANLWNGGANKILVTAILTPEERTSLRNWLAGVGGITLQSAPSPFDYAPWQTIAGQSDISYDSALYSVHSADRAYSVMRHRTIADLWRFEVRPGDMWSGDIGRPDGTYDRAELGAYSTQGYIDGDEEVWFAFDVKTLGAANDGLVSLFQLFSDQVEFQLQSAPTALSFITFTTIEGVIYPTVRHLYQTRWASIL